jgi:uncharacterized membrane protein YfcA
MNLHIYLPVAGMAANVLIVAGLGAAVGMLAGLFGVGGGFLITPLLIFIGIPTDVAIATGANQAIATSVSGAIAQWHRDNVDLKMAAYLLSSGLVGAFLGVQLVKVMKTIGQFDLMVSLCYIVFLGGVGIIMLVESIGSMRRSRSGVPGGRRGGQHMWIHGLPWKTRFPRSKLYMSIIPPLMVGMTGGILSAVMGVGGGFILVPAMVYILKMRTTLAIGTSLTQITFVSSATTLLHAVTNNSVDIVLGMLLIAGGVIGTQIGTIAGGSMKAEQLRALMALLVLAVCLRVLFDLVAMPAEPYSLTVPALAP